MLHPLSRRRQHTCSAYVLIPAFSFDEAGAKEKAIKKKTPSKRFRALRSATAGTGGSCKPLKRLALNFSKKAGENFGVGENFSYGGKSPVCMKALFMSASR